MNMANSRVTNSDCIYIIHTKKAKTVRKDMHTIIILSHSFLYICHNKHTMLDTNCVFNFSLQYFFLTFFPPLKARFMGERMDLSLGLHRTNIESTDFIEKFVS
jgi:hypothetical protein